MTDLQALTLGYYLPHALHLTWQVLLALWVFWALYIFMMGVYRGFLAGRLKGLSLIMATPILAVAFAVDFIMQMTVFTVVFRELPRHWLVTNRLRAYIKKGEGWRYVWASKLCHYLLDPFDPTGAHCDSDPSAIA
jgi:hypothetical protein